MPSQIDENKEITPQDFTPPSELTFPPAKPEGKEALFLPPPEDYITDEDIDFLDAEEERWLETEEAFYLKLPRKFISRGYKRPETAIRAETRRKYQHFRTPKKEKKRKTEKLIYDCIPLIPPASAGNSSPAYYAAASSSSSSSSSSKPLGNTPVNVPVNSTPVNSTTPEVNNSDPKYLSLKEERDYQEAVRQSSAQLAPTTGLSPQQILDMCNRDLTPEDYELLLRLDELVAKKTVKEETLNTLTEKTIDEEAQRNELCTVCMFNYELGDKVKYLPCRHYFHVDCIVPYLSSYGQNCPVCKAKV